LVGLSLLVGLWGTPLWWCWCQPYLVRNSFGSVHPPPRCPPHHFVSGPFSSQPSICIPIHLSPRARCLTWLAIGVVGVWEVVLDQFCWGRIGVGLCGGQVTSEHQSEWLFWVLPPPSSVPSCPPFSLHMYPYPPPFGRCLTWLAIGVEICGWAPADAGLVCGVPGLFSSEARFGFGSVSTFCAPS
jgi:hypothetical protein